MCCNITHEYLPMAELWIGAHPKTPPPLRSGTRPESLRDVIEEDKISTLGKEVAKRFGELPFLFKVLCADQPMSIQVHPSKAAAETGFARENAAGISLNAAERNYKDTNHKPELLYAITLFRTMNSFRELPEIVSLLKQIEGATHKSRIFFKMLMKAV